MSETRIVGCGRLGEDRSRFSLSRHWPSSARGQRWRTGPQSTRVQLAHFEGAARGRLDDGVADKKASQILQAEGDTPALHACCPTTPGGLILQRCGRNSDDDADAKTTRICCAGESCRHFASLEVEVAFPHALVTNTLMKMRCKSVVTKGGGRLLRTIGEVQHHTVIIIRSVVSARIAACNCTRLTWRLGRSTTSTAPHPWAGWGGWVETATRGGR